ncbi:MAG: acetyl-CoA carboxylase biotin carboxylase subunit [Acidimicrobiaceae bacterium]|nr:acetyl-CoA carboxylase biotin carboxylase subunit [Acidimicrobiaceae bacterium]
MNDINRLLIANRGEITVRIAKTAHRLGIETVGIYSHADRNALHADTVDTAIYLPGKTLSETYLNGEQIIQAAHDNGCDAIHPGYGFLAENSLFAQSVLDAELIWIGPTPEQIALLGDKMLAKKAAIDAGVPTVTSTKVQPGDKPPKFDMPVMVKAAAGGGGRGMRIVEKQSDLASAIESASREAESAFGDGRVFVEPYITQGRHIEVQIIGDAHGNVLHLGERECSIQRRNQKIFEEAPSCGISEDVRKLICDGAVALAKHVKYENAGTVEFLVNDKEEINFLEVNTRLQVEHPVTESITGLDLVELQIKVASGKKLSLEQKDIMFSGHAIEVRLVAENPSQNWMPSIGEIEKFKIGGGVRVDSGISEGSQVTTDFDSLIAKIISTGSDREQAIMKLARSLRSTQISGIETNLSMILSVLAEDDYRKANTPITYLQDHPEVLNGQEPRPHDFNALLIGAVFALEFSERLERKVATFAPSGWRNLRTQGQRQTWESSAGDYFVEYTIDKNNASVLLGPWPEPQEDGTLTEDKRTKFNVRILRQSETEQTIEINNRRQVINTTVVGETVHAQSKLGTATWTRKPRFIHRESEQFGAGPTSPLPGTVIAVNVSEGETVKEGDVLVVVEAMKMEHKIVATGPATVINIHFQPGDSVDTGDLLVSLQQDDNQ